MEPFLCRDNNSTRQSVIQADLPDTSNTLTHPLPAKQETSLYLHLEVPTNKELASHLEEDRFVRPDNRSASTIDR